MRTPSGRRNWAEEIRNRLERLEGLPLRPLTVRLVLSTLPEPESTAEETLQENTAPTGRPTAGEQGRNRPMWELDPGWVLGREVEADAHDPLSTIARLSWWAEFPSSQAADAVQKLWRHSVAVSLAARWLAREAEDREADRVAAAALLHNLGLWAVTAADPEWLTRWLAESDSERRRHRERSDLGSSLTDLGRRLAERWGCPNLITDAAWLHSPRDKALCRAASDPDRIALIQEAVRWAEMTPWSIAAVEDGNRDRDWDHPAADPRLRILVAEVQSRCGTPFTAPDATDIEERMTRQNARLRLQLAEARRYRESCDRFFTAFAGSDPAERPEAWAQVAGRIWCAEPEVNTARVVWTDPESSETRATEADSPVVKSLAERTPPGLVLPLGTRNRPLAEIQLWSDQAEIERLDSPLARAWNAWAMRVADRATLERRLRRTLESHREVAANEELRVRQLKLDALAEFAAGAGHEINNPLAVVVGRSQLLLSRAEDPEQARSLRIIMAQAQRAHRILRDLMFFARPPAPRPRPCRPGDLLRSCVADFQDESAARGVELIGDIEDPTAEIHADADALRHLAEILIRNAIQVTPAGGKVRVTADTNQLEASWSITDAGPGLTPAEGVHLFDPFYCGRQAGRGLGLGLPRAARIVGLAGGELRWHASPGHGATFQVRLPRHPVPRPAKGDVAVTNERPTILPIS